jgi:hypothetical protein
MRPPIEAPAPEIVAEIGGKEFRRYGYPGLLVTEMMNEDTEVN